MFFNSRYDMEYFHYSPLRDLVCVSEAWVLEPVKGKKMDWNFPTKTFT